MFHLIAKTQPNVNAIHALLGDNTQNLEFLESAESAHTFWCVSMPYGDLPLKVLLDSAMVYVTVAQEEPIFVSGNTLQWHALVRMLLTHKLQTLNKWGTMLVQSFPEMFKGLSTTTTSNGMLVLR